LVSKTEYARREQWFRRAKWRQETDRKRPRTDARGYLPSSWKPPADVRGALADVDARSLERYDRALVGFGARHALSSQDDPSRGIGAAPTTITNVVATLRLDRAAVEGTRARSRTRSPPTGSPRSN
jgi:hypothetical protein